MNISDFAKNVKGKTAAVLGIGVSNLPLIDFLLKYGMHVIARDKKTRAQFGEEQASLLEKKGVTLILGEHYLENIEGDYIFRSPGIRPDREELVEAVKRGAVLTSEMELFLTLTPAKVIAVTGSDGKTTTTTLISLLLREAGHRVFVGGNIGKPLLPEVEEMTEKDFAVLELSSFQLMTVNRSADIAVLTNLSPNHLDWHLGMEEYIEAKTNIFTHKENKVLVMNMDNPPSVLLKNRAHSEIRTFSSERKDTDIYDDNGKIYENGNLILNKENILLLGKHNRQNYMAAYEATKDFVSVEDLQKVALRFEGVEHRLEFVRNYRGIRIYNSSIDSSPSRTAAALSCFNEKVVVICGGYDKHIPFAPLAKALIEKAKTVVLTGATASMIEEALDLEDSDMKPQIYREKDFEKAVLKAVSLCDDGDSLLLSPACASFDAFPNFMVRGNTFKEIIQKLK